MARKRPKEGNIGPDEQNDGLTPAERLQRDVDAARAIEAAEEAKAGRLAESAAEEGTETQPENPGPIIERPEDLANRIAEEVSRAEQLADRGVEQVKEANGGPNEINDAHKAGEKLVAEVENAGNETLVGASSENLELPIKRSDPRFEELVKELCELDRDFQEKAAHALVLRTPYGKVVERLEKLRSDKRAREERGEARKHQSQRKAEPRIRSEVLASSKPENLDPTMRAFQAASSHVMESGGVPETETEKGIRKGIEKKEKKREKERAEAEERRQKTGKGSTDPGKKEGAETIPGLELSFASKTIAKNEDHPERNEDSILSEKEEGLFAVFDGVGGSVAGDQASRLARNSTLESLKKLPRNTSVDELEKVVLQTLNGANEKILEEIEKNPQFKGMGTTASILKIWESADKKERKAIIGQIGDSRIYVEHADGSLEQLTIDDSWARDSVKDPEELKKIEATLDDLDSKEAKANLTPIEQACFNLRNQIFQALGFVDPDAGPRVRVVDLQEGDRLILTSDGIHDNLTRKEIIAILSRAKNSEEAATSLTALAQERSKDESHIRAKADDKSVVIIEIGSRATDRKEDLSGKDVTEISAPEQAVDNEPELRQAFGEKGVWQKIEEDGRVYWRRPTDTGFEYRGLSGASRQSDSEPEGKPLTSEQVAAISSRKRELERITAEAETNIDRLEQEIFQATKRKEKKDLERARKIEEDKVVDSQNELSLMRARYPQLFKIARPEKESATPEQNKNYKEREVDAISAARRDLDQKADAWYTESYTKKRAEGFPHEVAQAWAQQAKEGFLKYSPEAEEFRRAFSGINTGSGRAKEASKNEPANEKADEKVSQSAREQEAERIYQEVFNREIRNAGTEHFSVSQAHKIAQRAKEEFLNPSPKGPSFVEEIQRRVRDEGSSVDWKEIRAQKEKLDLARQAFAKAESTHKSHPSKQAEQDKKEAFERYLQERAQYISGNIHRLIAEQRRLMDAKWREKFAASPDAGIIERIIKKKRRIAAQAKGLNRLSHWREKWQFARAAKKNFRGENLVQLTDRMNQVEEMALLSGKRPASFKGYDALRRAYEVAREKAERGEGIAELEEFRRKRFSDALKDTAESVRPSEDERGEPPPDVPSGNRPGNLSESRRKSKRRRILRAVIIGSLVGLGAVPAIQKGLENRRNKTAGSETKGSEQKSVLPPGIYIDSVEAKMSSTEQRLPEEEVLAPIDMPGEETKNDSQAEKVFLPITTDFEYHKFYRDNISYAPNGLYPMVENMTVSSFLSVFTEEKLLDGKIAAETGADFNSYLKKYFQGNEQKAFESLVRFASVIRSFNPDGNEGKMTLRYYLTQNIK